MKKKFLTWATTVGLCISAMPVTGITSIAEEASLVPDWVPSDFEEALGFYNQYGATHIEDGMICVVFNESTNDIYTYDIALTADAAKEISHDVYQDDLDSHKFEIVVYKPSAKGTFDVELNRTYNGSTRLDSSYGFYVDESGAISETDLLAWVPDCITEYNDFVRKYGTVSVHDGYIAYCADVNYSCGHSLIMEQNGTAEIKQIKESGCSEEMILSPAGNTSHAVYIYQPVSDGTVDISWKIGREWNLEQSTVSDIEKRYEVSENGTSIKETLPDPDDNTQRISVVDYYTGELLKFPETVVREISFRTGYEVEFILTDGTFAWGINWGPTSKWDYYAQNPYVIDTSEFLGGFGAGKYEVVDIDLPGGYFLPDDYLEVVEYDNDSADIYIKLKKTLPGDLNDDGVFSIADVLLLQKWLLAAPDTHPANWKAADLCQDDKLDAFDLCMMKNMLINADVPDENVSATLHSVTEIRGVHETWNGYIVRSENELNEIISENEKVSSQGITIDGIDKDFFNDKSLVVIYSQSSAGNEYFIIDDMTISGNTLNVSTVTKSPEIATPDMLYRRCIYCIDKNSAANVTDISFNDTSSYYQYEEGNDVVKWYKEWCQS